jgi:hypothetical protein
VNHSGLKVRQARAGARIDQDRRQVGMVVDLQETGDIAVAVDHYHENLFHREIAHPHLQREGQGTIHDRLVLLKNIHVLPNNLSPLKIDKCRGIFNEFIYDLLLSFSTPPFT